jgi:hypothetical protein
MVRTAVAGLLILLAGCASKNRYVSSSAQSAPIELTEKGHGIFVGHTDAGEVVIAASHYDAMNGLAILDTDLGIPAKESQGLMLCSREVITGSHLPRWMCRYQKDTDRNRAETQISLGFPVAGPNLSQGGAGGSLGLAAGGAKANRTAAQ